MSNGYSWTNTSQWSQIPTTGQQQQAPQQGQSQQAPAAPANVTPAPQTQMPQPQTAPISSESRRDMITRLYKEILAREPDPAGLNYYLFNSNITELQITKEMYQSTEHQEIISRSKDVREMLHKLEEFNKENSELKTKLKNAENLNSNYKILIDQKTQMINTLKSSTPQIAQKELVQHTEEKKQQNQHNDSGLILEDPFAEPQGKGCVGWLKNLFSFS